MNEKPLDVRMSEAFAAKNEALETVKEIDGTLAELQVKRAKAIEQAKSAVSTLQSLSKELTQGVDLGKKRGRPVGWRKPEAEPVLIKGKGKK